MRTTAIAAGLCAVLGSGFILYQGSGKADPRHAPAPSPNIPVVTAPVTVSDFPIVVSGIGSVAAYNVVDMHSQVTGTIEKIGFVEGQEVHPGDLIAQLDPRPHQAALQQAQANLIRDRAHLANAQSNLRRYVPLLKGGYASDQQVANQNSAVQQLVAAIVSDRAAIFNAQTQLGYTTIASPIDGITGIRRVDIGNIVQPSSTSPIVTITQIQPISVIFTLPEKDLPAVQAAMARHTLTAVAYGQDGRTLLDQGKLLLVDNNIIQSAGVAQLKAIFPNAKRMLWPGQFVNIRLILDHRKGGISVPLSALQQGQGGMFVFVVQSGDTVRERPVKIAETLNGEALINQGLRGGDQIVTAGQYRLSDGAKITEVHKGDPHVQDSTEASAGML